jgi:hypothetical protein
MKPTTKGWRQTREIAMTKDDLSELICKTATLLIADANKIIGHVRRGEKIDGLNSPTDFVDVMRVEWKAMKTFLSMWEKMK